MTKQYSRWETYRVFPFVDQKRFRNKIYNSIFWRLMCKNLFITYETPENASVNPVSVAMTFRL